METSFKSCVLSSVGHALPEHFIDNSFFESLNIGSSSSWVQERTGIKSRYSVLSEKYLHQIKNGTSSFLELKNSGIIPSLAELSVKPWQEAMAKLGYSQEDGISPDIVICGTSISDYDIPANASGICKELGLSSINMDINTACSSFVTNLTVAQGLFAAFPQYESIALFNIERYSTRLDYNDRGSCVLFGDGATVSILQRNSDFPSFRVVDSLLHSDPSGCDFVKIPMQDNFIKMVPRFKNLQLEKHVLL